MKVTTKRRIVASAVLLLASSFLGYKLVDGILHPNRDLFSSPSALADLTSKIKDATVLISCERVGDEYEYLGSSWRLRIEGESYLVTNAHVIEECLDEGTIFAYDSERRPYLTKILGYRHQRSSVGVWDIAVLQGVAIGTPLELSKTPAEAGHWIIAAGWPTLHLETYQAVSSGGVTGISGRGLIIYGAPIHEGMSGGPILNSRGQVVGVTYASTAEKTARSLGQPLQNLCGVVFECDAKKQPQYPLSFPAEPIKRYER